MKSLAQLSLSIKKFNRFGVSPIFQNGLNHSTVINVKPIFRSYSSSSSSSSSSSLSSPTYTDNTTTKKYILNGYIDKNSTKKTDPIFEKIIEDALSCGEEKKILAVNKILGCIDSYDQEIIISYSVPISKLINQLLTMEKLDEALNLFNHFHKNVIKNNLYSKNSGYFKKSKGFEFILNYYLKKNMIDELGNFYINNIKEYSPFIESKELSDFLRDLSKVSFDKFSELVYYIYDNSLLSKEFSINVLIRSLVVDKYTDDTFNKFFSYHTEKWGKITGKHIPDLLTFLILNKRIPPILQLFDNADLTDASAFPSRHIQHLLKLFGKQEKDEELLYQHQSLIFSILRNQTPQQITEILFFYNTFADIKEMKNEFKITRQLLSRLNNDFLHSLPPPTLKLVIDGLVQLFLTANCYEKALYWFNVNTTVLGNEISKESIISFIIYHRSIPDVTKTTGITTNTNNNTNTNTETKTEIGTNDKKVDTEINNNLFVNKKEYCRFWEELLAKILNVPKKQNYSDKELGINLSDYKKFTSINPYSILESIYYITYEKNSREIKEIIETKRKLKQRVDFVNDSNLSLLLKNDNVKGSEIFNFLNDNYLKNSQLPFGTLLLDSILKIIRIDKKNINNNNNNKVKEGEEFREEEEKSNISGYYDNNDSGYSRLANKEINFIQPMLGEIKNILIINKKDFDNQYNQILSVLPKLASKEELSEREYQALRVSLLNLHYYRSKETAVECVNTVITMIENDITIPFDVLEQTCWSLLEFRYELEGKVEKLTLLYKFIEKVTRENPKFEAGYLVILNYLIDSRKFEKALSFISMNENFKHTYDTLKLQTKCLLENKGELDPDWKSFLDENVLSLDKFGNYSFILNQIILNLIYTGSTKNFYNFEDTVLKAIPYQNQLINLSDEALESIILCHRDSLPDIQFYITNCFHIYTMFDFKYHIERSFKKNHHVSKYLVSDLLKFYRSYPVGYSTDYLKNSIFK
ncbi:hypothetical protein RB653_005162 [Dictyostelium firmibasis]|uniref:Uncharacterized protein n=1 Tax=Dictyostelium firmibasis TaxID=79012 RepID=A0AAN7Z3W8_9MYCE